MLHNIIYPLTIIVLSLVATDCKSTHLALDQETSELFIHNAHILCGYAQKEQKKLRSTPYSEGKLSIKNHARKKNTLKSLHLRKPKSKATTSSSAPNILTQSNTLAPEAILDAYMGALSLFTSVPTNKSPFLRIYLKAHISQTIKSLRRFLCPLSLDAQYTLAEPEYLYLWKKAQKRISEPYTIEPVLSDIKKKMQTQKKDDGMTSPFSMLYALKYMYNAGNSYQKAIIQSYASTIVRGTLKTRNALTSSEHKEAYDFWTDKQLDPQHFDQMIESLNDSYKQLCALCNTPAAQSKQAFQKKLIEEQTSILKNLLMIHHNTEDILRRYWIAKEAQARSKMIGKTLKKATNNFTWKKTIAKWNATSDDLCTILKHIMKFTETLLPVKKHITSNIEIHKEYIVAFCFNALPILIDLYQHYVLPPPLLQKITVPMRTILDSSLLLSHQCDLALSHEQKDFLRKAHLMTTSLTRAYATKYHHERADQYLTSKQYVQAKKHFILSAKALLDTQQQRKVPHPNFFEIAEHLYISLIQMIEKKISFSENDFNTIINLADAINNKVPPKILLQLETQKFSTFLRKINNKGLLNFKQNQASCSSNNQN